MAGQKDVPFQELPLVAGVAMAVCGALLIRLDPDVLARRRRTAMRRPGRNRGGAG